MSKRLEYSYDVIGDVLTIDGIRYAADIFRGLGILPVGTWVRIVDRPGDGTLTLESSGPPDGTPT